MILSIESSCDDSSIALTDINSAALVYHIKISQDKEHSNYGGVVPEIASRLHCQRLPQILQRLKTFLDDDLSPIKAVAVTTRPGLSVTLIEGLMMAKALCLSLQVPLICINHLKGHIYSLFIKTLAQNCSTHRDCLESCLNATLPLGVLLVSGGHTQILLMRGANDISILAQSLDDSFGESFDKVAKYLGLGYPGGPKVESYAKDFSLTYPQTPPHSFPVPLLHNQELAFSFSGLKNAVRLAIQAFPKPLHSKDIGSICAGFQKSACEHIVRKLKCFFQMREAQDLRYFAIVGGASANLYLRSQVESLCKMYDKQLLTSGLEFCSDNAAMIGIAAIEHYKRGDFTPLDEANISPRSLESDFSSIP
ncbi:tRNA (adenosine(37)-N6)-threonylcarbamoyltransferase complex transferase subunit TsaD [Helicobacter marmotae]|uniref:tRNA N6-adenosine threonylcarbamoyltransferase n=1 Tax=Helicobacter marmotae TaxID=152490 RepID=A0A3D8I4I1_9HELI|nr:tRNA (adenosine(37)-N6)-threonylcarbamoyltransferase complex transferase subunit TsaD [Helicobacter marmotae]RDU60027.1 tRNA (adenosine(37)-N6)-threonylcarbamoyltransferase complex transferase subunit TsaD [Helicobacter marmotae]